MAAPVRRWTDGHMQEIQKGNLLPGEAAAYSGIGINKLRVLSSEQDRGFALWLANRRLMKRRLLPAEPA